MAIYRNRRIHPNADDKDIYIEEDHGTVSLYQQAEVGYDFVLVCREDVPALITALQKAIESDNGSDT